MKGSNQVFALRQVDPGLAPHTAVDLGQKGGGYLNIANPRI